MTDTPHAEELIKCLRAEGNWIELGYAFKARRLCLEAADVLEALEGWAVERVAEAQAENAKLRKALERAELAMTCRNGGAHYCPNCDNTTFNAREEVRTALTGTSHEG